MRIAKLFKKLVEELNIGGIKSQTEIFFLTLNYNLGH